MAMSTFRRNTKSEQKKGGGKGLRGNWREQFRIPKNQPTPFVLIRGEYTDPNPDMASAEIDPATGQPVASVLAYYKWLKHRLKGINPHTGKQKFIDEPCSRGWDKHQPKPCAGCAAMDAGDKRITLGESYSMGLVHLKVYHRHPLYDMKKGSMIMKKDNSGPVMVDSECLEKQCNFCRLLAGQAPVLQQNEFWPNYDRTTIQNVFGSRRYLELGSGHLGDIGSWDSQIGSKCGGTAWVKDQQGQYVRDAQGNAIPKGRCNTFLNVDSYNCPTCGNVLIDADADPRSLQELEELASQKYPCHHCQRPVFMKEVNSCDSCGAAVVNGIFDMVLWGTRQGEDTQSHLVLPQFDNIEEFEQSLHPQVRALFQGKTLRQRIEELAKPYEFSELYKPKSLEEQAKRLEIQSANPYGQQASGWAPPGQPMPGYPAPQQPMGYGAGAPQYPQGQTAPQPQYQAYGAPQGPGPAPFVPPQQPNFSK